MSNVILKYLNPWHVFMLVIVILFQQFINALGTYSLIQTGLELNHRDQILFWMLIMFVAFAVGPFLSIFSKKIEVNASMFAYRQFLHKNLFVNQGKPYFWQQTQEKDKYLTAISTESESYITAIIFVFSDMFSYVLQILLNILIFGLFIDLRFIPAYLTSLIISAVAFIFLKEIVTNNYNFEQKYRIELNTVILKAWNNIFFNNQFGVTPYFLDTVKN